MNVKTWPVALTFLQVCNLSLQISETEYNILQSQVYNCDLINDSVVFNLK